ncbi:hypothetical protein G3I59_04895 [Amycolatopsis rubida]|uniref:Uncharacterized protein n=1 Tax=Amycolatopsis rubida TaxID=112413 RepID=A0ABX0BHV1_9PSEU|nr:MULTISPECIES: hypothetical protein [Amycolatopsis]MYW89974.1 hypothetical protein [Amycolatopsis rubida]NEC54951.1 hypothetical protein [Amycolatopsis rubida]
MVTVRVRLPHRVRGERARPDAGAPGRPGIEHIAEPANGGVLPALVAVSGPELVVGRDEAVRALRSAVSTVSLRWSS